MTTKQKILDEIEACYAQGEWGGERPEETLTQKKNIAWFLPRPKQDHYKGGMPLFIRRINAK